MSGPRWVVASENGRMNYEGGYWSGDCRTFSNLSEDEQYFVSNHERASTLAESSDPLANYDFDDYALALLDDVYYVFNTSGCSCPSQEENWGLIFKGDRSALLEFLNPLPGSTESWYEFLREVQKSGIALLSPAPVPSNKRLDW